MATSQGTWRYRDRFGDDFGRTYFRRFPPGVASSIGLGTYLGDPTPAVDDGYREAIETALGAGCNLLDTATNYRAGRSERVVGQALRNEIQAGTVDREEVIVCSKAGFLPFDGRRPDDPAAYVREQFVEPGLVDPEDVARGSHCIAPEFVDTMVDRTLDRTGLDHVDCYYVHNPETQLTERSAEAVYDQLEAAFEVLEERVLAGDVGGYGVATWEAFRVSREDDSYLSLSEVVARAAAAAETVRGEDEDGEAPPPAMRAIQLPFNVHMADAFTVTSQTLDGDDASALELAHDLGLPVVASASLLQGDLADGLPDPVAAEVEGDTPAQRAINFARSAPGVTAALVGTSSAAHLREDLAAGTFDPLGAGAFDAVFE